jgi:hypothetical protein
MMLVNSGFHARKYFAESYPQLGHAIKLFTSPFLGRKSLKNLGLNDR